VREVGREEGSYIKAHNMCMHICVHVYLRAANTHHTHSLQSR
jgi:hypothetical protein